MIKCVDRRRSTKDEDGKSLFIVGYVRVCTIEYYRTANLDMISSWPAKRGMSSGYPTVAIHAPPSRFAYSSSMRSSYTFSAASSASDFEVCCAMPDCALDTCAAGWESFGASLVSEVEGFSVVWIGRPMMCCGVCSMMLYAVVSVKAQVTQFILL